MNDRFVEFLGRVRAWFASQQAAGWLTAEDLSRAAAVETETPGNLFRVRETRPLVVAFFGGTGVGKSSLLNRIAQEEVARTGVERPTSREATLYVHESVELAELPPDLPVDRVQVRRHGRDAWRAAAWLDTPDIDSTEAANRENALAWLPYVDLVVYVVSPERYRDDAGWRVLQQRQLRHGWLFVINRWDEGDERQRADFVRLLRDGGFEQPLVLCTSCAAARPALPSPDEFDRICEQIDALLHAHGVQELERLGYRARLSALRVALDAVEPRFGDEASWERLLVAWSQSWATARASLEAGVEHPLRQIAARFAARDTRFADRLARRWFSGGESPPTSSAPPANEIAHLANGLWDDWCQKKVESAVERLELALRDARISAAAVLTGLQMLTNRAGPDVLEHVQDRLREALSAPGTRWQRIGRRITGFLVVFLPLTAIGLAGVALAGGFWRGATGQGDYVGSNFAIHAALLVLVAWAFPFILDQLLRPSVEGSAHRGMKTGLLSGLDAVDERIRHALDESRREAAARGEELRKLSTEAVGLMVRPIKAHDPAIAPLLGGERGAAVKR